MSAHLRSMQPGDHPAVLEINAASQPHVAHLDDAELRRLVDLSRVHWVAVEGDEVLAYLLAISGEQTYDGEEFGRFQQIFGPGFLYVDQIAIRPGARRAGLGLSLYAALEDWCGREGFARLCCEVNLRPTNPASLRFHEKAGFVQREALEVSDGRLVAMLVRALG